MKGRDSSAASAARFLALQSGLRPVRRKHVEPTVRQAPSGEAGQPLASGDHVEWTVHYGSGIQRGIVSHVEADGRVYIDFAVAGRTRRAYWDAFEIGLLRRLSPAVTP